MEFLRRDFRYSEADKPDLKAKIDVCIKQTLERLREGLAEFGDAFPSACGEGGRYLKTQNPDTVLFSDWTSSFWTGMLGLAYELSDDTEFRSALLRLERSFEMRLEDNVVLDHHDIGFLYTLSSVAAYKLTGDEASLRTALAAAEKLAGRYNNVAQAIMRGGINKEHIEQAKGGYIIDTCLNTPLLFWAAETTQCADFYEKAYLHMKSAQKNLIRTNGASLQLFKINLQTGETLDASSPQGANEEGACWSRGQAWALYGFPISYRYTRDRSFLETACKVANYYLNRVQEDFIPNWDFLYQGETDQRDSSAASIAVCGLLELARYLPLFSEEKAQYEGAALHTVEALIDRYFYAPGESNALLKAGVYAYKRQLGVNEPQIWGDYFFLEALVRLTKIWNMYW